MDNVYKVIVRNMIHNNESHEHLKSQLVPLFIQKLVLARKKETINGLYYWPFVKGIHCIIKLRERERD